jgi:hypothetical protein
MEFNDSYDVLRGLINDAFECCYTDGDIDLTVNFKGDGKIEFSYNCQPKNNKIPFNATAEQYEEIKDNLLTITDKKGAYINLAELCFAFNAKKKMSKESDKEYLKRTLNLTITEDDVVSVSYKLAYFKKTGNKFIRVWQNNKSIVDFICHEYEGLCFLIPFAVAASKRQSITKVFMVRYNFFSIYELTSDELPRKIKYEKLSAFFISVPYELVSLDASGNALVAKVEQGVKDLIKTYSRYLVLDVYELPNIEDRFGLRPRSYAFGFIRNFVTTSKLNQIFSQNLAEYFLEHVCLHFPEDGKDEEEVVRYSELRETAFSYIRKEVSEEDHRSGKAYRNHILGKKEDMVKQLSGHSEKSMYLSYEWVSGREFYYEFVRPYRSYIIESRVKPGLPDYGLYSSFNSFAEKQLFKYFAKGSFVEDEKALEAVFAYFDDAFNRDYKVTMRYYQLYVTHKGKTSIDRDVVNISKINITNLKNAIDTLKSRRDRFDSPRAFSETVKMLVNIYTQGKDIIECLIKLREQGVRIKLGTDANGKIRFSVYGSMFLIPARTTASQMYSIVQDIGSILEAKMWNDRVFDFPTEKVRYFFDADVIERIFEGKVTASKDRPLKEALELIPNFSVSDLKMDKVAVLDEYTRHSL